MGLHAVIELAGQVLPRLPVLLEPCAQLQTVALLIDPVAHCINTVAFHWCNTGASTNCGLHLISSTEVHGQASGCDEVLKNAHGPYDLTVLANEPGNIAY